LDPVAQAPDHAVILVTSSCSGEGKSTTTVKLAVQFAAAETKVLLIDGDMRRGSLHAALALPNEIGLAETLAKDGVALGSAIQYDAEHGFSVLTCGHPSANPAELLSSKRFAVLLAEAVRDYDVVLIDGPPVLGLADAPRLSKMADATIFIVEANRTSIDHVKIALQRLADAGASQIGIVISKYDPAKDTGSFSYGYQYDYGAPDSERRHAGAYGHGNADFRLPA
jgi:capsular exopolysaccharide synthesis family protein